ncbi:eukaryotic translation initiation factor-like protein [Tanacetum coccineum]
MPRGVQPPLLGKTPSPSQKFLPQDSGGFISGKSSALYGSGELLDMSQHHPTELKRRTISLLEEYFSVLILDEALQCVEELSAPEYHIELVKEAVSLALEKIPPLASIQLIEFLVSDYLISWSKTDGFTTRKHAESFIAKVNFV